MFIYLLRNSVNCKVYVGKTQKTVERRWNEHLKEARGASQRYLCRAIRKYGPEAFTVTILHSGVLSIELLNELEKEEISNHHSSESKFGYNQTIGGDGNRMSAEVRQRWSAAMKGRYAGEKNPFFGRHHDEATRQRMSESRTGKVPTPEHIKNRQDSIRRNGSNLGPRHHMWGKKHSPDKIEQFRRASSGENNAMYGRSGPLAPGYGRVKSAAERKMLSEARKRFWASKTLEEKRAILAPAFASRGITLKK